MTGGWDVTGSCEVLSDDLKRGPESLLGLELVPTPLAIIFTPQLAARLHCDT